MLNMCHLFGHLHQMYMLDLMYIPSHLPHHILYPFLTKSSPKTGWTLMVLLNLSLRYSRIDQTSSLIWKVKISIVKYTNFLPALIWWLIRALTFPYGAKGSDKPWINPFLFKLFYSLNL